MSDISLDEIAHIARLARIAITDEEAQQYQGDVSAIVDAVASVGSVDTANVAPMSHPGSALSSMREDTVEKLLTAEQALDQAPQQEEQRFEVPQILGE